MNNDVNHRNVLAVKQHSEETRKMLRVLETKINTIDTLLTKVGNLESQLRLIQVKLYSGGATS